MIISYDLEKANKKNPETRFQGVFKFLGTSQI